MGQCDLNREVVERFQRSRPCLVGIDRAKNIIPGFQELTVLHAGPAIQPADMNGPMRGAAIGSLVYEGIERDYAARLLDAGELDLRPCHDVGFVGPMAGVVTGRMPVWVVEDQEFGNRSYATLNEGLGKVLRFGASDRSVMQRLRWMEMELAPALDDALVLHGPIDLKDSISEALRRGDEAHNRNKAGTASFVRELAPELVESCCRAAAPILEFLRSNDHFFLNISMASSKCSADAAQDAGKGSVVTAMDYERSPIWYSSIRLGVALGSGFGYRVMTPVSILSHTRTMMLPLLLVIPTYLRLSGLVASAWPQRLRLRHS